MFDTKEDTFGKDVKKIKPNGMMKFDTTKTISRIGVHLLHGIAIDGLAFIYSTGESVSSYYSYGELFYKDFG